MGTDPDFETLMVRYQLGDLESATALIRSLSPQLLRFFMIQSVSRKHADDLLQETWLRIHEARHTYRPGERLLPWLYAIARHVRVDHYRRARRVEIREQQVGELPEYARPVPRGYATPDIAALLGALPESQREVIVMLKVLQMSLEEVARATSSSVGSVKQKAHRGYSKLREIITRMGFNAARPGDPNDR